MSLKSQDLRERAIIRRRKRVINGLGSSNAVMIVSWILLVRWQSCSGAAIRMDEDGVTLDKAAVGASEWLLRADVAGRFDVDAMVDGDIERRAF